MSEAIKVKGCASCPFWTIEGNLISICLAKSFINDSAPEDVPRENGLYSDPITPPSCPLRTGEIIIELTE